MPPVQRVSQVDPLFHVLACIVRRRCVKQPEVIRLADDSQIGANLERLIYNFRFKVALIVLWSNSKSRKVLSNVNKNHQIWMNSRSLFSKVRFREFVCAAEEEKKVVYG